MKKTKKQDAIIDATREFHEIGILEAPRGGPRKTRAKGRVIIHAISTGEITNPHKYGEITPNLPM